MEVIEVNHPLVQHKLGLMRCINTGTKQFRELTTEISSLLTYAATSDLVMQPLIVEGWEGPVPIAQIKGKKITVVPIMRAGLGMMAGVLQHLPNVPISMVGLYRDEVSLQPVAYFQKLAANLPERTALVVDVMLATGGSIDRTIQLLKNAGCQQIKLLVLVAAPEGIAHLEKAHPGSEIVLYTAAVDQGLNPQGYIVPGLGDAGDRLFATR